MEGEALGGQKSSGGDEVSGCCDLLNWRSSSSVAGSAIAHLSLEEHKPGNSTERPAHLRLKEGRACV